MQKLAQRAHIVRSLPRPYLYVLTVGLWAFAVAVSIRRFSAIRQPEDNPWFWSVIVVAVLVLIEGISVSRFGYHPLYYIGRLTCRGGQMIAGGIQYGVAHFALIANPIRRIEHWLQQGIGPGFRVLRDHMLPGGETYRPTHLSRATFRSFVTTSHLVGRAHHPACARHRRPGACLYVPRVCALDRSWKRI